MKYKLLLVNKLKRMLITISKIPVLKPAKLPFKNDKTYCTLTTTIIQLHCKTQNSASNLGISPLCLVSPRILEAYMLLDSNVVINPEIK
ncbi:hypothetical protein [Ruminiclostridium cellulolyticum]|uniref:hypothetical protein n=1 Tax=Ruminiclostridium cellulolyticum TaxID=1521 RepID=UPI0012FBABEE|nr:hypothetical protein [Ruminiclostridium cellulolyticum]